jgi:hypothetical protein
MCLFAEQSATYKGGGPAGGAWHTSMRTKIPTSGKIVPEIIADFQVTAPGRRPIFFFEG